MSRPLMSLFTDASMRWESREATWAFWAKLDGKSISYGAKFKSFPNQTWEAEMNAMVNALHHMTKVDFLPPKTHLLWQSDSVDALARYAKLGGNSPLAVRLLKEHSCSLSTRHVRGHVHERSPKFQSRNWVNNLCDRLCREAYDKKDAA